MLTSIYAILCMVLECLGIAVFIGLALFMLVLICIVSLDCIDEYRENRAVEEEEIYVKRKIDG